MYGFGKSLRQRLADHKAVTKRKKGDPPTSAPEQNAHEFDDSISIADNLVPDDFIDYIDDFNNPDSDEFFDVRQQYEHVIDLQEFDDDEGEKLPVSQHLSPLYDNSHLSDVEFSMGVMALARANNLSDASVNMMLDVFRCVLPEPNKIPSTYNKIKTIVQKNSPFNLLKRSITICAFCMNDYCNCGKLDKSILLIYDVQLQIQELLSRYGDIMQKYRDDMLAETNYMDIHQSQVYRDALDKCPNMLPVSIYTDGGRYTHTGSFEGWPIALFLLDLPPKLRFKYSNIIFSGYWYSKQKPNWPFIFKNVDRLLRFTFNDRDYRMKYLQVVADIPARQGLLSMNNIPGYNTCFNCDIKGEYHGHVIFPYAQPVPRDPRTFIDCKDGENGIKGESVLLERLENFPGGVVIDVMHSVYRGPIQDDIKKLIHGFRRDANVRALIKFDQETANELDEMITKLKFPKEYQRNKIRSLAALSSWKVSELKIFGLYVIPTCLIVVVKDKNPVLQELVGSMMLYICAIRMLTQSKISEQMVQSAEQILHFWLSNRQKLWTKSGMTFKAHESLHLPNQVRMHGCLAVHSAFAGESAIGQIGKNITCYNADISSKQIGERMSLRRACLVWLERNGVSQLKKYFVHDKVPHPRLTEPLEEVKEYLLTRQISGIFKAEIHIDGFSLSPFGTASDNTNCYVALKAENNFIALKLMAIVETSSKDVFFCGYSLKTTPYSNLINPDTFLASQPLAYEYCCYGFKETIEDENLVIFDAQDFLAKYVCIEASNLMFFMTMPHAYEHN